MFLLSGCDEFVDEECMLKTRWVEKATLAFPGVNQAGAYFESAISGYPVEPNVDGLTGNRGGGAVFASVDNVNAITQTMYGLRSGTDVSGAMVKLAIPEKDGMRPAWIGIDPASAIHTADLYLGGRTDQASRIRISPGNPALGEWRDDFVLVSIPNGLPRYTPANNVSAHDFVPLPNTAGGWPLRLEIGYGCAKPWRAPYRSAYIASYFAQIAASGSRAFMFCADGRKRVDIIATSSVSTTTITVENWTSRKETNVGPSLGDTNMITLLPMLDDGSTSDTLTAGQVKTWSFYGNPMDVLVVNASQTTAQSNVSIKIKAYDD